MAKTTRYEPQAAPLPAGQAPGSAAEVIRRARGGPSAFSKALLQGARQPRQRTRSGGVARGIAGAGQSIAAGITKRGDIQRQERQIQEGREFQVSEREAREATARSVEESQRAYREEQTELARQNEFVSARAQNELKRISAVTAIRRGEQEQEMGKAHRVQEVLMAGGAPARALADAAGISLEELQTETEQEVEDLLTTWRGGLVDDEAGFRDALLEWQRRGTASNVSGEGMSLEMPELPRRAADYALSDFLRGMHENLQFLDNEQLLTADQVHEGKLKMAIATTALLKDGKREFRSTMQALDMPDAVAQLDRAEPLVKELVDIVAKASNEGTAFAKEDIYRAVSQLADIPEAQEVVFQVLSGTTPSFRKDVSSAAVAGIVEGYGGALTQALKALEGADMQTRLKSALSYWGREADALEVTDRVRSALRTARSRIHTMKIDPEVAKWTDPGWDPVAHHETSSSFLLQALEAGGGKTEMLGGLMQQRRASYDDVMRQLGQINDGVPFDQLLSGRQRLSPAAEAKARKGMSPLKAGVGAPVQFRSPAGGGQAQPAPATPSPMLQPPQQQPQQPQQPPVTPPLVPQATMDSLIQP